MLFSRTWIIVFALACHVPAYAQWADGQNADYVIFQPDFTTQNTGAGTQQVQYAVGAAVDAANSKLYVADFGNNRVLRFNYPPISSNNPAAELVLGQSSFSTIASGNSASQMSNPWDLAVDSTGRLYVADSANHRVLVFDAAHTISTNGAAADRVLGQTAFGVGSSASGANRMNTPRGLHVDSTGNLWVTEWGNQRVTRFNDAGSKVTGASADAVLGQLNFTDTTGGSGQNKMNEPGDACVIGTTLFVADGANHRVLRFDNVYSISDGANANGVLGQVDFVNIGSATTQSGFNRPHGLTADRSGRLYVTDHLNYRVLTFNNAVSKSNGANADNVLGQINFTNGTAGSGQNRINDSYYSVVDDANNRLLTSMASGHKVVIFIAGASLPVSVSAVSFE